MPMLGADAMPAENEKPRSKPDVAAWLETGRQDPPGDEVGLLGHGSRHQHRELVAADAERAVGPAQRAPQQLADLGEGLVADGMAGRVVESLKSSRSMRTSEIRWP